MSQKTTTINGRKYTAARLIKIADKNGVELNGGDISTTLPCGACIAVRKYKNEEGIAVLNWGGINRKDVSFGGVVAFLA